MLLRNIFASGLFQAFGADGMVAGQTWYLSLEAGHVFLAAKNFLHHRQQP